MIKNMGHELRFSSTGRALRSMSNMRTVDHLSTDALENSVHKS